MLRDTIVNEVTRILQGPLEGNGEQLDKNPLDFYSVGVLFPQVQLTSIYEEQDDSSVGTGAQNQETDQLNNAASEADPVASQRRAAQEADEPSGTGEMELTTKFRPSAAGISVLTPLDVPFNITVRFATYSKQKVEIIPETDPESRPFSTNIFKHQPHESMHSLKGTDFRTAGYSFSVAGNSIFVNLHKQAELVITTRPYPYSNGQDNLVIRTFTLINTNKSQSQAHQKNPEMCLYQPAILVETEAGFQAFEDRSDLKLLSDEDINLKLLYRNYKIYAQGHGISVNWEKVNNLVTKVMTQVLPQEKVNGVNLDPEKFRDSSVLYMKRLSGAAVNTEYNWQSIHTDLISFIDLYKAWIDEKEDEVGKVILEKGLREQARKNLVHCKRLYERMQNGIRLLSSDRDVRKAFEDANRAMFMQRVMADFSRHRRTTGRVQHDDNRYDDDLPDFRIIPADAKSGTLWENGVFQVNPQVNEKSAPLARWRPFQLAFLLSQLEGVTDPLSADRDTVDLIWFPTGGGKTEAYLGLTAFSIFFRRLTAKKISNDPDKGAGVSVLMRYTLRLLNKQQFERATILICSCDLIRRAEPDNYGKVRISNGIWMGRSMSPNTENDQRTDYAYYIQQVNAGKQPSVYKNSPPLLSCPCCGNRLIREVQNNQVTGRWGYFVERNTKGKETGRYLMACTNTRCAFYVTDKEYGQNRYKSFPVYEVDETIYRERPSLLFSTVDKFVQLAWRSEAFNLFNLEFADKQIKRLFPAPELIIQDELHLISSALGTIYGVYEIVVDKLCRESEGFSAKVVGATATVRNAEEQCRRLYGRKHFLQFPPPAIDADDSFYSTKIKEEDPKNRLYVGFMPSGITTSTALIRLTSVLLERIPALSETNEKLDNYYTLVVYFNALKELGKFRTFLTDDIVAYRKMLANQFGTFIKSFNQNSLCELSSVMTADEITKGLDRLEKVTLPKGLDNTNLLIKTLFEAGIRTRADLKIAKGGRWKTFLDKSFFDQIGLPFTGDNKKDFDTFFKAVNNLLQGEADPIQIAPATNMISVGVDIPRLNTMIVNGQPKTTAEYIQASSRVGREGPGVVFTFLAPTKNRDRSHYEQFKAFHQAYYYYVEASSVTPFSQPALEKVLPTVLVALTRSLFLNGSKGVFNSSDSDYLDFIRDIIREIQGRANAIHDPDNAEKVCSYIDTIFHNYFDRLSSLNNNRRLAEYSDFLRYDSTTEQVVSEIRNPGAVYNAPAQFVESLLQGHIPTMQTLRNVESSSKVRIKSN